MEADSLRYLYECFLAHGGNPSVFVENRIASPGAHNRDRHSDSTNHEQSTRLAFSDDGQARLLQLFRENLIEYGKRPLSDGQDAINAFMFLQELVATALWKYRISVVSELEAFARDYDRLDADGERERLYVEAGSLRSKAQQRDKA